MPDFEARIESGTATVSTEIWTDVTPGPSGYPRNRRNPHPGFQETFLLATGSPGDNVELRAVPMGNAGRHDGADASPILWDSSQSWTVGALVGSIVENLSDGSSGTITANTTETVTAALSGGTYNNWGIGDRYRLRMADAALDGRLFSIDCVEHPGTPPFVSQASGWSAEATVGLLATGHHTFTLNRPGGGGLIMHLDAEVT